MLPVFIDMEDNYTFEKTDLTQDNNRTSQLNLLFFDICDFFGIATPDTGSDELAYLLAISG